MKSMFLLALTWQMLVLCCPSVPSYADNEHHRQRAGAEERGGSEWLDKFSGFGRESDFQAAMRQERAAWRFYREKNYDQAINSFKQAIQLYPNLPAAYVGMGQSIEHSGGPDTEAEAAYRSSIKCNTDDFRAWHRLAAVLYHERKYVEARKALDSALQLNPPPRERRIMENMITGIAAAERNGQVDAGDKQ